ncbi:hypothetical protein DPMN_012627 [Dreissena polymorpha]|uniref:Uncharacterized protein n=1 Tax=Dreissena polymorpha TaxID=45954 RepID=A0A9D4N7D4_DREPO|nr:hypothetical protein DPMN_012627 [Dreissena polymorpha]
MMYKGYSRLFPPKNYAFRKLKSACASSAELRITEVKKANLTELYYSRAHNFAYCKVPKSGSTFWMNVFMVMQEF